MYTCVRYNNDDEKASVFEERIVRARKEHICCECNEPIKPGETYEYYRGLYDGYWSVYRTCAICKLIANEFFPHGYRFELLAEDLWDSNEVEL